MENARLAFLWAREADLACAAVLSARAAQAIGFSVWRQDVTDWMLSLEPTVRETASQSLPLQTQAFWWSMLTYVLNVRRSRSATPAARKAYPFGGNWTTETNCKRRCGARRRYPVGEAARAGRAGRSCPRARQLRSASGVPRAGIHDRPRARMDRDGSSG